MKKNIVIALILPLVCILGYSCKTDGATYAINDCPFVMPKIEQPTIPNRKYDIQDYGAVPNGITDNTVAINKAIEECSKNGGGIVVVPQGLWLTGPIKLKSHIELHLEEGAVVTFSRNLQDYPLVRTYFEGWECVRCQSPISGRDLHDIAITGQGVFDGSGDAWRPVKKSRSSINEWDRLIESGGVLNETKDVWLPSESSLYGHNNTVQGYLYPNAPIEAHELFRDYLRPNMFSLINCERVFLEGVTFQNSPCWTIHPFDCSHIIIDGVKVRNPWYAQNADALDLESCRIGLIQNCTFDTGDDGICIKSGKNKEGRDRDKPTELFVFRNNKVFRSHGGFVIGSEMSGGARNLYLTNCSFIDTDMGFRFKSNRNRGGVVENIYIDGVYMSNILKHAIFFGMDYVGLSAFPAKEETKIESFDRREDIIANDSTPIFRNFIIENVYCSKALNAITMLGLEEMPLKQITIKNSVIHANTGVYLKDVKDISLDSVNIICNSELQYDTLRATGVIKRNTYINNNKP
ncbi:glycoside hydrolase family 28 protein [Bacteroides eggerthii]|uniref:glycoside hydrolase family 28 protein n=1 Tax=Bacteroides eggerthii TaxID=28111 RepID=UPI00356A21E3